jgi:predicted enzyme related to lactoylglutathione lyase
VERAKRSYKDTVGWTFEAMQTPAGKPYVVAVSGGKPVAGMLVLASPEFDAVPESWISLRAVEDVDERVAKATAAGDKLVLPIFEEPTSAMAMLKEPGGGAGVGWITPVK